MVNFSYFLIKGKYILFELAENSSYLSKMTEKWGKIKLSKFELSGFYCIGGTCEELFIVLFHSLKGKPCFPLGRGFCRSFSQRVLYA